MLILGAKIALNAIICMIIFLDNGVMTTPKRRILSFVFTVLCNNNNNNNNNNNDNNNNNKLYGLKFVTI